jgi:hypothetical protein
MDQLCADSADDTEPEDLAGDEQAIKDQKERVSTHGTPHKLSFRMFVPAPVCQAPTGSVGRAPLDFKKKLP